MSTFKHPVGAQPEKVYWRRRLIVGLGLLAVILVIVLIVVKPGSSTPAGSTTPTSTPTAESSTAATPAPTTSAAPVAEGECDPANVQVTAVTDATTYGTDTNPKLSLSIVNGGSAACEFSAGSDVQEYQISSGEELIWSSKDCQEAPVAAVVTLEPAKPMTAAPIDWNRTRSDPDACEGDREKVTAGGASYHLKVIVNGIESAETKQFLLN